jgi:hypothetical protein
MNRAARLRASVRRSIYGSRWLALLMMSTVCSPEAARRPAGEAVMDSAGVQLVHDHNGAIDTTRVTLVGELRIGRTDGPEPYQLHMVRGVAVDGLRRIYVSDGRNSVHVYDSSGVWVRDIGRAGSGPGEFKGIFEPLIRGGSLGVFDSYTAQFSLFDTSGVHLGSVAVRHSDGSTMIPLRSSAHGWSVARIRFPSRGSRAPAPGTLKQDTQVLGHMSSESLLSLSRLTTAQLDSAFYGAVHWPSPPRFNDNEGYTLAPLFQGEFSVAHDDSGRVYLTNGYPYDIHVYDASGRLERRIRREHEPRAVTQSDVDEWVRLIGQRVPGVGPSEGGRSALDRERRRADGPRADYFPVIRRLLASDAGELWVQRSDVHLDIADFAGLPNRPARPTYWDVFDSTGRYEFTVKLPPRMRPMWIEGRAVMGVQRDENDLETVVRYRLVDM